MFSKSILKVNRNLIYKNFKKSNLIHLISNFRFPQDKISKQGSRNIR